MSKELLVLVRIIRTYMDGYGLYGLTRCRALNRRQSIQTKPTLSLTYLFTGDATERLFTCVLRLIEKKYK